MDGLEPNGASDVSSLPPTLPVDVRKGEKQVWTFASSGALAHSPFLSFRYSACCIPILMTSLDVAQAGFSHIISVGRPLPIPSRSILERGPGDGIRPLSRRRVMMRRSDKAAERVGLQQVCVTSRRASLSSCPTYMPQSTLGTRCAEISMRWGRLAGHARRRSCSWTWRRTPP